jgi:hypothetical protein
VKSHSVPARALPPIRTSSRRIAGSGSPSRSRAERPGSHHRDEHRRRAHDVLDQVADPVRDEKLTRERGAAMIGSRTISRRRRATRRRKRDVRRAASSSRATVFERADASAPSPIRRGCCDSVHARAACARTRGAAASGRPPSVSTCPKAARRLASAAARHTRFARPRRDVALSRVVADAKRARAVTRSVVRRRS